MADQTPDPTAWDDDQLDDLLDALAERAAERDDLHLPGSGASRRGVLASLLGLGGAAAGAGVASAIGESESYGSASGVVGTDSEPVNEANVQDLHAQDAQIDTTETEQISIAPPSNNGTTRVYRTVDGVDEQIQTTTNVDTTATTILDPADLIGACSLVLVSGDDSGDRFKDLVFFSRGGQNPTVLAQDSAGSPATRSYDSGVQDEFLNLTMASGSYKVRAKAVRNAVV